MNERTGGSRENRGIARRPAPHGNRAKITPIESAGGYTARRRSSAATRSARTRKKESFPDRFKRISEEIAATAKDGSQAVDKPLLFVIIILLAIGLITMFSASYAYAYEHYEGNSSYFIVRQLGFAVFGLLAMFLISFYPSKRMKELNFPIFAISLFLLILVLFLPEREYVHRWIDLGITTFQPSEITKFSVILFCATWADTHMKRMETFKGGVLPFIIMLIPVVLLLLLEPHISCTVLILLITLTMMYVGGTKLRWFGILGAVMSVGLAAVILSGRISYSKGRIAVWLDPFSDSFGQGWQNIQALYAISSGGLLGVGLGHSRQKYLYISEPQNDFVFAVICEELGFIGAVGIMALFLFLVWRGFSISVANPSRFCKLLGIGITAQVGWQALLNIAVVTKTIPNTGISLPFFSYGGTSLVMLLMEMGVLLGISRGSRVKRM